MRRRSKDHFVARRRTEDHSATVWTSNSPMALTDYQLAFTWKFGRNARRVYHRQEALEVHAGYLGKPDDLGVGVAKEFGRKLRRMGLEEGTMNVVYVAVVELNPTFPVCPAPLT